MQQIQIGVTLSQFDTRAKVAQLLMITARDADFNNEMLKSILGTCILIFYSLSASAGGFEALARISDKTFYESCSNSGRVSETSDDPCDLKPNEIGETTKVLEASLEDFYFAGLARERSDSDQCGLDYLIERSGAQKIDDFAKEMSDKTTLLADLTVQTLRVSKRIEDLSRSLKAKSASAKKAKLQNQLELQNLQAQYKKLQAGIAATENSIPFSNQVDFQKLLSESVQEMVEPATSLQALTAAEMPALKPIDPQKFQKRFRSTVQRAKESIKKDLIFLKEAASTNGANLDRASKESLAQDRDLIQSYLEKNPKSKEGLAKQICSADATYGRGAVARDNALMAGSIALTAVSLGVGAVAKGGVVGATMLSSSRLAAARGLVSLRTARIFSAAATGLDATAGLNALEKSCSSNQRENSIQAGNDNRNMCEGFSAKSIATESCALDASLSALGITLASPIAQKVAQKLATRVIDKISEPIVREVQGGIAPIEKPPLAPSEVAKAVNVQVQISDDDMKAAREISHQGLDNAAKRKAEIARLMENYGEMPPVVKEMVEQLPSDMKLKLLTWAEEEGSELKKLMKEMSDINYDYNTLFFSVSDSEDRLGLESKLQKAIDEILAARKSALKNLSQDSDIPDLIKTYPRSYRVNYKRFVDDLGGEGVEAIRVSIADGNLNGALDLIRDYKRSDLKKTRETLQAWRKKASPLVPEKALSAEAVQKISDRRAAEYVASNGYKSVRASVAEVKDVYQRYPKLNDKLTAARARLRKTELSAKVEKIEDLKMENVANAKVLRERIKEMPGMEKVVLGVWNRMNDSEAFANYSVSLAEDAAVLMAKSGTPRELDSLRRGEVTRNAVLKALVARHRAQGRAEFSTVAPVREKGITRTRKSPDNAAFREAVGQGPFFDKPFKGLRHGVDTHFLQEDYVSSVVHQETNGNPKMFWDFVGSKKGINIWVPLFDNFSDAPSLARPEFTAHQISDVLKITD